MKFTEECQVVGNRYFMHFAECADKASLKALGRDAVLTSGVNGEHQQNSLHYKFKAWDLRVWVNEFDYKSGRFRVSDCESYASELRALLGSLYDVVVHYKKDKIGTMYVSHIHVEYDPR